MPSTTTTRITDFSPTLLDGTTYDLSAHAGDVVLVVNTASKCSLTPQYAGLEELWQRYADDGLVVLGFPCTQFGGRELSSAHQIQTFCWVNYATTFPISNTVEVNGPHADPLWSWLRRERPGPLGSRIWWNFTKFLIGRDGLPISRHAPLTYPERLESRIEAALALPAP